MYSLQSHKLDITIKNCTYLAIILLFNALIFILLTRPSPASRRFVTLAPKSNKQNEDSCLYGRVYVYDLPPILNKNLLNGCNKSSIEWTAHCNPLSNNGFGPHATSLKKIMPRNLTRSWYWTDLYAGEVIYHKKMLNYKCRTRNEDEATAFYIPFYVGLAIGKMLWANHTAKEIDLLSVTMLNWVENRGTWKRRNGSDHFIFLGRLSWDFRRVEASGGWGTSFLNMPLMKNVLRLTPERSVWDPLEFSVPYPNPFHPRSLSDIREWQSILRAKKRSKLFSYVGGSRNYIKNDFRGVISNYCKSAHKYCKLVDCSVTPCYEGASATIEAFLNSDFCLQPKGDGYTRRATFDCMLTGSIPVFFWNGSFENQYMWHLPKAANTYSVFIDSKEVRNDTSIIKRVLERYSKDEVKKMREMIIDLIPNIVIAVSNATLGSVRDAFDITTDEVLRRFKKQIDVELRN